MDKYPFALGATSLTKPVKSVFDNFEINRQLGFDVVEVTLEYPRTMPITKDLKETMLRYKTEYDFEFTIHLPLSLQMTSVNPHMREGSLKTLEEIFEEMKEVAPKAYVLHVSPFFLTGGTPLGRPFEVQLHQDRLNAARETLSQLSNIIDPQMVAVENLFHDIRFLEEFIHEFDYGVCMDVGHILLNKSDLYLHYHKYKDRIKVIHLHDVVNGSDHQQLGEEGSQLDLEAFFYLLKKHNYNETIILEQFKIEHLNQSLSAIENAWHSVTD